MGRILTGTVRRLVSIKNEEDWRKGRRVDGRDS